MTFSEPNPFALQYQIIGVNLFFEWDDERLNADILPEAGVWVPSESYTVTIDLCGNQPQFGFGTSNLGAPLEIGSEELIGRTYFIDLSSAVYSEPPGVGSLLSLFLDMPLLLGVDSVSSGSIDYEAYLGYQDDVTGDWNSYVMDPWLFSGADFSEALLYRADGHSLRRGTIVHDFNISGTFAPDGLEQRSIFWNRQQRGNGVLGFGNDPDAVCTLLGD